MTLQSLDFARFQGPKERAEDELHDPLNRDSDDLGAFRALIFAMPVSLALWVGIILGLAWLF